MAIKEKMPKVLTNDDHIISYLPLSHIAAQMLDMYCPLLSGTQCWFAQPDALRGSLGTTLKEVRPTVFFGVPRVWEKIYDKMQIVAKSSTGVKKMISTWAKGKAANHWENHQYGGSMKSPFMIGLATKLLGKVRDALGLDRVSQTARTLACQSEYENITCHSPVSPFCTYFSALLAMFLLLPLRSRF